MWVWLMVGTGIGAQGGRVVTVAVCASDDCDGDCIRTRVLREPFAQDWQLMRVLRSTSPRLN